MISRLGVRGRWSGVGFQASTAEWMNSLDGVGDCFFRWIAGFDTLDVLLSLLARIALSFVFLRDRLCRFVGRGLATLFLSLLSFMLVGTTISIANGCRLWIESEFVSAGGSISTCWQCQQDPQSEHLTAS